jgi:lipid A 3-O-deacylase
MTALVSKSRAFGLGLLLGAGVLVQAAEPAAQSTPWPAEPAAELPAADPDADPVASDRAILPPVAPTGADSHRQGRHWTFSFYFENDLFANTDKNYTNGIKFTWISPNVAAYSEAGRLPRWAYRISRLLPFINEPGSQRNVAITLGQNIYTPTDIQTTQLLVNDRPYAGWLYIGAAFHNKTTRYLDTLEVNIGVIGPLALGRQAQNFVHRAREIPTAKGWDNQLRNEPAINLIWERKHRRDLVGTGEGWGSDLLWHYGASLGNVFTYANVGGTLRFGWNLPRDFGAAVIRPAGDSNAPASGADVRFREGAFSIHAFVGVDGRAVARDATLEGNTWRDSHGVDAENWVGDFNFGVAFIMRGWKVSYAQIQRSRTFRRGDSQAFGSMNISFTY